MTANTRLLMAELAVDARHVQMDGGVYEADALALAVKVLDLLAALQRDDREREDVGDGKESEAA
jgi:hypothetical protein